eukprot:Em0001g282a
MGEEEAILNREVILLEKLYNAVDRCEENKVISLLKEGAFIDKIKETALMRAASNGNERMLRFLLDRGAQVNVSTVRRWLPPGKSFYACNYTITTPFITAVQYGSPECIQLLLDRGGQVNCSDILVTACGKRSEGNGVGTISTVLPLLHGAGWSSVVGQDGNTPLIVASHCGNLKIMQLLLDKGAQVNLEKVQCQCIAFRCVLGIISVPTSA